MAKDKLRKLIYLGMLVGIGVVLAEVLAISYPPSSPNTVLRFSLGYLTIILAGLLFGPVYGGIAGIAQDLIGFFLFGSGAAFQIGYTLNAMLYGLIPGLLFLKTWKNEDKIFYLLNYLLDLVFLVAVVWYFFNINQVYSTYLTNPEKYILAGVALFGTVSLLCINFFVHRMKPEKRPPFKMWFMLILLYMITSLVLTPIWLYVANPGLSFWVRIPIRILKMPIDICLYAALLPKTWELTKKMIKKEE
jgi:ECF transporter S component (folate family)